MNKKKMKLTLVSNDWGEGLYDDSGNLLLEGKLKNGGIQPDDILECLGYKVVNFDATGAGWEFDGNGFPGTLADATDMSELDDSE